MDNALVHGLVYQGNGWAEQLGARILIGSTQCRPQFLDLRPKLAAVAAIYRVPLFILPYTFFG